MSSDKSNSIEDNSAIEKSNTAQMAQGVPQVPQVVEESHNPPESTISPEMDEATRILVENAVAGLVDAFDHRNRNVEPNGLVIFDPLTGAILTGYYNGVHFTPDMFYGGEDEEDEEDEEYYRAQAESINEYQPPFKPAPDNTMDLCTQVDCFEGEPCSLCLDDDIQTQGLVKTQCNHIFHKECLSKWLSSGDFCPVCRHSFKN
jgi:hypothetical protein